MADVAAIFHWPPAAMDEMTVSELMGWRARAAKRSESSEPSGKRGAR